MSVEFYRGSPGNLDSRTLSRKTLSRWTRRMSGRVGGVRGTKLSFHDFQAAWFQPASLDPKIAIWFGSPINREAPSDISRREGLGRIARLTKGRFEK